MITPGVLLGMAWIAAAGAVQDTTPRLAPCALPGVPGQVLCGVLTVSETPGVVGGRTIGLRVVVARATGASPKPDPIVMLTGGPGQGAASIAAGLVALAGDLRDQRDLVFVDRRGTGGSAALRCELPNAPAEHFGHLFHPDRIRQCGVAHAEQADLRQYITPIAMDDLDRVRAWLGYERVNVVGQSFGTREAMVYYRQYPDRVRTLLLDGVVPLDVQGPLRYARAAEEGLDRLFTDCAADARCREMHPDPRGDLARLLARLDSGPVATRVAPAGSATVSFSRGDFGYTLRGLLYGRAAQLLDMLHRAAGSGDFSEFAGAYYQRATGLSRQLAIGQHLLVLCSEDVPPTVPESQLRDATEGTFLGDYLVREYATMCPEWRQPMPRGYGDPVRGSVPVLLLSGSYDPTTPPAYGDRVAALFPNAFHVVFARAGHGSLGGPCALRIAAQFLDRGSTQHLDTTCAEAP